MELPLDLSDRPDSLFGHVERFTGASELRKNLWPVRLLDPPGRNRRVVASDGHIAVDAPASEAEPTSGEEEGKIVETDLSSDGAGAQYAGTVLYYTSEGRSADPIYHQWTKNLRAHLEELPVTSVPETIPCPDCEGSGHEICPHCGQATGRPCSACGGRGETADETRPGKRFTGTPTVQLGERHASRAGHFRADYLMLVLWTLEAAEIERFEVSTTQTSSGDGLWVFYPYHQEAPGWQKLPEDWHFVLAPIQKATEFGDFVLPSRPYASLSS